MLTGEQRIAVLEPVLLDRIAAHLEVMLNKKVHDALEAAATAPLLEQIAQLESNEKVLLAQIQGHTQWREKITKAIEQAYGESAIRYKFSLTKNGKCMNTFPKAIDGRWFALVPAEDDGHIGHIARIAQLEQQLAEARRGLAEVEVLIGESYGVAGLHLNGDVAPWSDLREGGHFEEWLLGFDAAIAQVNAKGGEA